MLGSGVMRAQNHPRPQTLQLFLFCLAAMVFTVVATGQRGTGPGGTAALEPVARALNGAIDIHVHSLPENAERSSTASRLPCLPVRMGCAD